MSELNYRSPLYIQLREIIRGKIEDGEYQPGTAIPSENQLAEAYGLNRLSVRSAVEALENEGLLKSVQGKGVFVQGSKTLRDLETLGGYRHTMQERGRDASTKVLVKAVRPAGPLYAHLLKLSPDQPSWTITAQPGPWVGPFHWDNRRLRVPEIAAIQTFPKDYKFVGSRRSVQKQIGNAVPCLMGKAMVTFVKESLE